MEACRFPVLQLQPGGSLKMIGEAVYDLIDRSLAAVRRDRAACSFRYNCRVRWRAGAPGFLPVIVPRGNHDRMTGNVAFKSLKFCRHHNLHSALTPHAVDRLLSTLCWSRTLFRLLARLCRFSASRWYRYIIKLQPLAALSAVGVISSDGCYGHCTAVAAACAGN